MQIKTTMRYHFTPVRTAAIQCHSISETVSKNNEKYACCSVAQSCPTLCDPMNHSTPGFPVHHQLLKLAQTHVHFDGDAIQPSHPVSSPSSPAFNLSQHQGPFK